MKTFYLIYLLGIFLPSNARKIINEKIVNGEEAVLGQFPYQVLWAMESNGAFYVNCGGSIYNKSTIITAGHCCVHFDHYPLSKTKIIAGQIEVSGSYGQVIEIDSYLIHPDYDQENKDNNWNDVCLLTLKTDLEYNDNVKCIKLNDRSLEPGTKCIVSGWGRLEVFTWSLQKLLMNRIEIGNLRKFRAVFLFYVLMIFLCSRLEVANLTFYNLLS